MPRPRAGGLAHALKQGVAAGDERLEPARGLVPQFIDEHAVITVDEDEPRVVRPRREHVGETHSSNLPAARDAIAAVARGRRLSA
ncbi:hypothetical protein GCM10027024_13830 [Microbacterium insulae]